VNAVTFGAARHRIHARYVAVTASHGTATQHAASGVTERSELFKAPKHTQENFERIRIFPTYCI